MMKYKINLYIGFISIVIGILNCLKGINGQVVVNESNLIIGIIVLAAGMGNLGIFVGGNQ